MNRRFFVGVVAAMVASAPASADDWHVGTNLRTELSTHAVRFDAGYRIGRLDLIGVVDPMVFTDGELDVDAIADWQVNRCGYAVFVGWRPSSIALAMGRQFQETALVGATAPLPKLRWVDLQVGLEIATVLVKHGGGLPTDVTSFATTTDIGDNVNISMFLRIGYAHRR